MLRREDLDCYDSTTPNNWIFHRITVSEKSTCSWVLADEFYSNQGHGLNLKCYDAGHMSVCQAHGLVLEKILQISLIKTGQKRLTSIWFRLQ